MRKLTFTLILLITHLFTFSATDLLSENAEISLLTCSPGNELYSLFGHSAIRVKDSYRGFDRVYNYGTFDFNTPNFYLKFIKGQLDYLLSTSKYKYFEFEYLTSNRAVYEQKLNLTFVQKQQLFENLEENYLPENRGYRYDFIYDNCATRIRDMFENSLNNNIVYNTEKYTEKLNFRDLLDPYINKQPWLDFGINLALGLPADKIAVPAEYMFLPDPLMDIMNHAYYKEISDSTKLLADPVQLVKNSKSEYSKSFFSPLNIFILLLIIFGFITYREIKNKKQTILPDQILFFLVGLLGALLTFLWFGTEHLAMNYNLNFIWAMPLNIIIVFIMRKEKFKNITKYYYLSYSILLTLTLINWTWFPQQFHYSLIPLILILIMRSFMIYRRSSKS